MSEEAFEFFDTDCFFDKIAVAKKDGCGKEAIIGFPMNEISDFCHYCVIDKCGLGSQLGTVQILIHGVFTIRVDVPRGGWSMR